MLHSKLKVVKIVKIPKNTAVTRDVSKIQITLGFGLRKFPLNFKKRKIFQKSARINLQENFELFIFRGSTVILSKQF